MSAKKNPSEIRPRRLLELVGVALGIPLGVVLVLTASSFLFHGGVPLPEELRSTPEPQTPRDPPLTLAQAQAREAQGLLIVAPNVAPATYPRAHLRVGDEFHRQLDAGVREGQADMGSGGGRQLYAAARNFLRRGDVLARRVTGVRQIGSGWNLFVGKYEPRWQEYTEWCLRLHFEPGDEKLFAYTLWRLENEVFGDTLGLPPLDGGIDLQVGDATRLIDPHAWQGLLLPVQTQWSGPGRYGERADHMTWQLLPNSDICATARQQAAGAAALQIAR